MKKKTKGQAVFTTRDNKSADREINEAKKKLSR
jgi:hypothetical protein